MKIFRDRFDRFLNVGQNLSKYESLYRSHIDEFPTQLTYENVDAYFKTVSDVKINIAYTPIEVSLFDCCISETIPAGLKRLHAPL